MHLKHPLGGIETQRGDLHLGWLAAMCRSSTTTSWHINAVQSGPSRPINSTGPEWRRRWSDEQKRTIGRRVWRREQWSVRLLVAHPWKASEFCLFLTDMSHVLF
jgi:hypothetical protein